MTSVGTVFRFAALCQFRNGHPCRRYATSNSFPEKIFKAGTKSSKDQEPESQSNPEGTADSTKQEWHDPYAASLQRLTAAGISLELAKKIIASVDEIAKDQVAQLSKFYLTREEYERLLQIYHSGIDRFYADSTAIQRGHFESVRKQYDILSEQTVENVNAGIIDQVKALESGLQLDINLEKKKIGESLKLIQSLAEKAEQETQTKLHQVLFNITNIGKQATLVIAGGSNTSSCGAVL